MSHSPGCDPLGCQVCPEILIWFSKIASFLKPALELQSSQNHRKIQPDQKYDEIIVLEFTSIIVLTSFAFYNLPLIFQVFVSSGQKQD